jgi:adenylate kinase family enzyme
MLRLILEGPDNAGKTTLADYLRQHVPHIKYFHPGGPPANMLEERKCVDEQMDYLLANEFALLDRTTTISQRVYNQDNIADRYRASQCSEMLAMGCLVIYARPTTDKLMAFETFQWKDHDSEAQKQKVIQRQHEFIGRYDAIMRRTPHIAYDFTDVEAAQTLRDLCVRGLKGDREAIHGLRNLPGILLRKDL